MNDLDLLRAMRADAPEPTEGRLAAGRARLDDAIAAGGPSAVPARPRGPRARLLVAGVVAGALVTAGAVALVEPDGDGRKVSTPSVRLASAGVVLNRAAQAVETQPEPVLKPRQWLYYELGQYEHGSAVKSSGNWIRLDGMEDAAFIQGKLLISRHSKAGSWEGTPLGAYQFLAKLPTDPKALLAALTRKVGSQPRGSGVTGDLLLYENIQQLLWNSLPGTPPRVQAAVFRALAGMRGIEARTNFQYAPGRTAMAVVFQRRFALLFDPRDYRMIGEAHLSAGAADRPAPRDAKEAELMKKYPAKFGLDRPLLPVGTVVSSLFRPKVTLVGGPGRR